MSTFHRPLIVVGVDGTPSSGAAADWAAAEAVRRHVPLRVVNAYQLPATVYPAPGLYPPEITEATRMLSEQTVDDCASGLRKLHPELDVEVASRVGHPVLVLQDESRHAVMTVVGSHGTHQFTDAVSGAIAGHLAGHAHSPVVVIRTSIPVATPGLPLGPVIVGVDDSPHAQAAIGFAFDEAALRGARLVAIHTWDERPISRAMASVPLPMNLSHVAESEQRLLAEQLAGWADKYPDVSLEHVLATGYAAETLLERSGPPLSQSAQLLVVGSRGRGGFAGLLLGSTSAALIAHARCPVAVVRDDTDSPATGDRPAR